MESLQDKIETEISNIKQGIETTNEEVMRRMSEFVITSNEISTEQTRLLESYATNFASLGRLNGLKLTAKTKMKMKKFWRKSTVIN